MKTLNPSPWVTSWESAALGQGNATSPAPFPSTAPRKSKGSGRGANSGSPGEPAPPLRTPSRIEGLGTTGEQRGGGKTESRRRESLPRAFDLFYRSQHPHGDEEREPAVRRRQSEASRDPPAARARRARCALASGSEGLLFWRRITQFLRLSYRLSYFPCFRRINYLV